MRINISDMSIYQQVQDARQTEATKGCGFVDAEHAQIPQLFEHLMGRENAGSFPSINMTTPTSTVSKSAFFE